MFIKRAVRHIYPSTCVLCGDQGQANRNLCESCEADLPFNTVACGHCGLPMETQTSASVCGQCLSKRPIFDHVYSPFVYAQPLEWMIHQFKFNAKLYFGDVLTGLFLSQFPDVNKLPDCIIPVPLHRTKMKQRGYNQSFVLARLIAKQLNLSVDTQSCKKNRHTAPQMGLDASQRYKNVKGAFSFNNYSGYQHIVLLDDVITTGSTVSEITRIIKREGVEQVDVWSIARAAKK